MNDRPTVTGEIETSPLSVDEAEEMAQGLTAVVEDFMQPWTVTVRTGRTTWSTVSVEANDHAEAVRIAQRLLGDGPVTKII